MGTDIVHKSVRLTGVALGRGGSFAIHVEQLGVNETSVGRVGVPLRYRELGTRNDGFSGGQTHGSSGS